MNFGGARGEKLEKLTRIVVHMGDPKAAFLGVAFDYDGDVSLFGRQGETELSFLIDGPKGERISEVTTTQAPNSMGIRSLHVCFFSKSFLLKRLEKLIFSILDSHKLREQRLVHPQRVSIVSSGRRRI